MEPTPQRQALWTFRRPGYNIALIPHSEKDRARLKREAKKECLSQRIAQKIAALMIFSLILSACEGGAFPYRAFETTSHGHQYQTSEHPKTTIQS